MVDDKQDTEKLILEAARKVFIRKGLDGARMQEIADEAGINKALLHYYFRSKEKLFEIIFSREISLLFPTISGAILSEDVPFESKIRLIVDSYINLFLKHPFLPLFILREINRDPANIKGIFEKSGVDFGFIHQIAFVKLAEMLNVDTDGARHFMVNLLSLCIVPFAAKPLLEKVLFNDDEQEFVKFLEERKVQVADFIICAIKFKQIGNH